MPLAMNVIKARLARLYALSLRCLVIFNDVGDHVMPEFPVY